MNPTAQQLFRNLMTGFQINEVRTVPWRILFMVKPRWTNDEIGSILTDLWLEHYILLGYECHGTGVSVKRLA